MTDLKYRIVARDKDGKELGHMTKDYFNGLIGSAMLEHYPSVASFTIERLPPEEAEPRRVWLNVYSENTSAEAFDTAFIADAHNDGDRTACVQFIEAKITDDIVRRVRDKLMDGPRWGDTEDRGHFFFMGGKDGSDLALVRAALAAAWEIEE